MMIVSLAPWEAVDVDIERRFRLARKAKRDACTGSPFLACSLFLGLRSFLRLFSGHDSLPHSEFCLGD